MSKTLKYITRFVTCISLLASCVEKYTPEQEKKIISGRYNFAAVESVNLNGTKYDSTYCGAFDLALDEENPEKVIITGRWNGTGRKVGMNIVFDPMTLKTDERELQCTFTVFEKKPHDYTYTFNYTAEGTALNALGRPTPVKIKAKVEAVKISR